MSENLIKKYGQAFKIKRCNFFYDQFKNPIEEPIQQGVYLQDFKVINVGKALENPHPLPTLKKFIYKFIRKLAKYVNLSNAFIYTKDRCTEIGYPNRSLNREIEVNAFCSLASIRDPEKFKYQPAYQPLVEFLKQKIGLSNNPIQLEKGFATREFMEKAELHPIKFNLDKDGTLVVSETRTIYHSVTPILVEAIYTNMGHAFNRNTNKIEWHKCPEIMLEIISSRIASSDILL